MASSAAVFAQVVVDIPSRELGDKLFTYKVPDYLRSETFIGTQVLVPFGGQELVGGYVVDLHDRCGGQFTARDIIEILDTDPLFDRNYIEFLYWVADYYCATLSSVISAAVPSDTGPRLKRLIELTSLESLEEVRSVSDPAARKLFDVVATSNKYSISIRAARQKSQLKQGPFYKALGLLKQLKLVTVKSHSSAGMAPKLVRSVMWTGQPPSRPRQQHIVATLQRYGGQMSVRQLLETASTTSATIKRMCAEGLLAFTSEEVIRDPLKQVDGSGVQPEALTDDQRKVMSVLSPHLDAVLKKSAEQMDEPPLPWLLHGVTGSGKTEVYLRLIQQTLQARRTALLLVPEISLTPQLAQRLKSRFGSQVAIWHSALSPGERYDTWRRLRCGDVSVLLGARSAVLANMPGLGLIILDEEHDGSYKQSSPSPRYQAHKVVLEKARRAGAMVLFGSATPDISSYFSAIESRRLLQMPQRVFKQQMPDVALVDMRAEFSCGNRGIFSTRLQEELKSCLDRKEQAILLMNRRGYASHVFCRACGYVVKCRNCSVSLVYHQPSSNGDNGGYLSCHHCGFHCQAAEICPGCHSPFLRQYGLGTQRVEQEVTKHFPQARILRLDSDVTSRRGAHEDILSQFSSGKADILIGTQMVSKGLDIAGVTLVGVLAADAAFNLPDYRSVERGFQLLTQVSGRAGRGDMPGQVVLQTFNMDLPALQWARQHAYEEFAAAEIEARRELNYPPFGQLIRVVVAGGDVLAVEAACERLAEEITKVVEDDIPPDSLKVLGPAPCLIERLRGNYRFHLLIKNMYGETGRTVLAGFLRNKRLAAGLSMAVDVDAIDLL